MGHAFFVESEDDAAAGDDHGPADQPGFFGHHADGFAARGRVLGQVLFAIGFAVGIEEIGMVAWADQLFEFGCAQSTAI